MPTVLMLTYHFPPSSAVGGFRLLGFTQHLPKYGWRTAVVAPPELPWEPNDPGLADRVPAETVVYSAPYPRTAPKIVRWMAPYAIWLASARPAVLRAVRDLNPDVVLTSGPPHWIHLMGLSLKNRFRIPCVADFRDPWITNDPMPRLTPRRRWEALWERRVFAGADAIIANTPAARAAYQAAHPRAADRVVSIPNGFDPETFPTPPPRQPGPLRVVHAGQLYDGRDPGPLLDAVRDLPPNAPPFRLEFLGRTKFKDLLDLDKEVRERGLENLVVNLGQLPHEQSVRAIQSADLLLVLHTLGRKLQVPAKVYEYLGAGRPILALGDPDGGMAALLADSGVPHRVAPPNEPGAIRSALLDLVHAVAEHRLPPADSEMSSRYSREVLAGRLAEVLNHCRRPTSQAAEPELTASAKEGP